MKPLRFASNAIFLALVTALSGSAIAEGLDPTVTVFYPGRDWVLRLTVPALVETYNNHKAGISSYFIGASVTLGVNVSVEMVAAQEKKTAAECRGLFIQALKGRVDATQFTLSEANGIPRYESFAAEPVKQKHIHVVQLHQGICAKTHVSKVKYQDEDRPILESVLASMRFEPITGPVTRSFIVSRSRAISLRMPVQWGFDRELPKEGAPFGMWVLEPSDDFRMGLRLVDSGPGGPARDEQELRKFVNGAKDRMLASSVEADAPLQAIEGKGGKGFYYEVTNRMALSAQKKGKDWRFVTQGVIPLQEHLVIFTVYTNEKDTADVRAAFDLVRNIEASAWRAQ
jgi:hypothetical protein